MQAFNDKVLKMLCDKIRQYPKSTPFYYTTLYIFYSLRFSGGV